MDVDAVQPYAFGIHGILMPWRSERSERPLSALGLPLWQKSSRCRLCCCALTLRAFFCSTFRPTTVPGSCQGVGVPLGSLGRTCAFEWRSCALRWRTCASAWVTVLLFTAQHVLTRCSAALPPPPVSAHHCTALVFAGPPQIGKTNWRNSETQQISRKSRRNWPNSAANLGAGMTPLVLGASKAHNQTSDWHHEVFLLPLPRYQSGSYRDPSCITNPAAVSGAWVGVGALHVCSVCRSARALVSRGLCACVFGVTLRHVTLGGHTC